jgi:hypothetical protein
MFCLVPRPKRQLRSYIRLICKQRNLSVTIADIIVLNKSVSLFHYKNKFTFSVCVKNCGNYIYGTGKSIADASYQIFYHTTTKFPFVLRYQGARCMMTDHQIEQKLLRAVIDSNLHITMPGAKCHVRALQTGKDDVFVRDVVEEEVAKFDPEIRKKYIRSSDVTDANMYVRGAMVHHSEESKKPFLLERRERAIAYILFICNNAPSDDTGAFSHSEIPEPPTFETPESSIPVAWATIPVSDSSSGYRMGENPVSKRENCMQAAQELADDYLLGKYRPNISMMAPKAEMLLQKLNAKVRQIFVQTQKTFIVLTCLFGSFLHTTGSIENGDAISAPTNGNFGARLFMRLAWCIGNNYKEAVRRGLFEADASKWESTTKIQTIHDYCLFFLSMMSPTCLKYGCLLPGAVTDVLCPIIGISDQICMMKQGIIESGSKLTCHENTMVHKYYTHCYSSYVMSHGGIGKHGCSCGSCAIMSKCADFGKKPDELELRLLMSYVVLGDDFICINNSHTSAFIFFMDNILGTVHKDSVEKFEDGKFLQRSFKVDAGPDGLKYITTYRPTERALSRLFGPGAYSLDRKIQQCISLAYECNNPDVTSVCKRVHDRLVEKRGHLGGLDDGINQTYDGVENYGGKFPTDEMVRIHHAPDTDGINQAIRNRELILEYGTTHIK